MTYKRPKMTDHRFFVSARITTKKRSKSLGRMQIINDEQQSQFMPVVNHQNRITPNIQKITFEQTINRGTFPINR